VKRSSKDSFKGRQFTAEIILWAVRWYLQGTVRNSVREAGFVIG